MTLSERFVVIWLVVVAVGFGGYVANIVRFCKCDFRHPLKAEVIRAVGIVVPPIGAVVGFIGIEDSPKETANAKEAPRI